VNPLAVFKTAAFNHSATLPTLLFNDLRHAPKEQIVIFGTKLAPSIFQLCRAVYHSLPIPANAVLMASDALPSSSLNICA
jgi:hypothetical protein